MLFLSSLKSGDYNVKCLGRESNGHNILRSNAIISASLQDSWGVLICLSLKWEQGNELGLHGGSWKGKALQKD